MDDITAAAGKATSRKKEPKAPESDRTLAQLRFCDNDGPRTTPRCCPRRVIALSVSARHQTGPRASHPSPLCRNMAQRYRSSPAQLTGSRFRQVILKDA
jgi:hypothetical protein